MRELSHEKRKLSKRWVIHRLRYYMNEVGIKDFDYYDNLFSGVKIDEYYGAAEPPVRCGVSHLSGLTEPPVYSYSA